MNRYESWGRFPKPINQEIIQLYWHHELNLPKDNSQVLPFGKGRSYGDVCLNDNGILLDASGLNRFISFNPSNGILHAEAGVTIADIIETFGPRGWFPHVVPGTKHVTVGGAIANDIHGKNHHRVGTFGCHVLSMDLIRTDNGLTKISQNSNNDLFAATIGGLGLTGLITSAELQLKRIQSEYIDQETIPFKNLNEFYEINQVSEKNYEYCVAWIDALSRRSSLGRGIYFRGNHSSQKVSEGTSTKRFLSVSVPTLFPGMLINKLTISAFNKLYRFAHARVNASQRSVHYNNFFFPLDGLSEWNRLYGRDGFLQYQFVVPHAESRAVLDCVLERFSKSNSASFLAVLKSFGSIHSPGILSFPQEGMTLAVDLRNQGEKTLNLLDDLDKIVADAKGKVYPAKDARMSPERFVDFYPQVTHFEKFIDPSFSSSFIRRVYKTN